MGLAEGGGSTNFWYLCNSRNKQKVVSNRTLISFQNSWNSGLPLRQAATGKLEQAFEFVQKGTNIPGFSHSFRQRGLRLWMERLSCAEVHFPVKMKWNCPSSTLFLSPTSQIMFWGCLNPMYPEASLSNPAQGALSRIQNLCSIAAIPALVEFSSFWHCSSLALVSASSCCRADEVGARLDRRTLCSESFCLASRLSRFCLVSFRAALSSEISSSRSWGRKFVQRVNKIFVAQLVWNVLCLYSWRISQSHTSHIEPSL